MRQLVLFAAAVTAASSFAQLPPATAFTTICQEDMASGFSWKSGQWAPTKFKPDGRLHIKRYSADELRAAMKDPAFSENKPFRCMGEDFEAVVDASRIGEVGRFARRACYLVKEFGKEGLPLFNAETCYETFEKSVLTEVQCKTIRFDPNGLFIRLPWDAAMDVSAKPKDDYKDSLSLAVGKCSSVE